MHRAKHSASTSMLPIVLTRAYRSLVDFLVGGLTVQGISLAEFAILEALLHKGPLAASVIESKVTRLPTSQAGPVLKRLLRRGLIRTRRNRDAPPGAVYDLTEDGYRRITRVYRAHEQDIDAAVGVLTREEQKALWKSLKTVGLQSDRLRRLRSAHRNGGLAPWQVRRVTDYMSKHLSEAVPLKELAAQTGLSSSRFGRAFKASMGVSPHRWQLNLRVQHAQELLRDGASSLAAVSLAAGFTDQSHFSRVFKGVVGVPPGSWQREHRF